MSWLGYGTQGEVDFLNALLHAGKHDTFRRYAAIVLHDQREYDHDVDVVAVKRFINWALGEMR